MKLIDIKCDKCGAMIQVNAELPKCMCQYCGNEIQIAALTANTAMEGAALTIPENIATVGTAQTVTTNFVSNGTAQTVSEQDDPNEVAKYKNMMKMNIIIGIIAFVLLFFIRNNIILTGAMVIFLICLPLREANKCLKAKKMLIRNGSQKGNIVGLAVLIMLDVLFWILKLISQFASI